MNILMDSIDIIKGIGPKTLKKFHALAIYTVQDLLDYFPFRYDNRNYDEISEWVDGKKVTIQGIVAKRPHIQRYGKKTRLIATVNIGNMSHIQCVWFNQPYAMRSVALNMRVSISGKYVAKYNQIVVATFEKVDDAKESIHTGRIIPIYRGSHTLHSNMIRKWVSKIIAGYCQNIQDDLPIQLQQRYKLTDKTTAYQWIHFPSNSNELKQAKRRLIFEEFYLYQLRIQIVRENSRTCRIGIEHQYDSKILKKFVENLAFGLTKAQKKCIKEILADIKKSQPMYRLLHGDVGAGKTIVATIALLANWTSKYQGALMVPTEILAEQQYNTIKKDIEYMGVRLCLLTSKVTNKQRNLIVQGIKNHQFDIVIGTHALIQKDVVFSALGLVIIDEQHRFGVNQRELLRQKGNMPDVLSMTATPIPRTMAMTIYGDFDISVLDELPIGRKQVQTKCISMSKEYEVYDKLKVVLEKKQQVYIVCPLIEESDQFNAESVYNIAEKAQKYFVGYQVGVIHGQLKAQEKDAIMGAFILGKIHILVSTTVIEVGVNIVAASAMVIYNAERFGLSQLHQLRGRVGRNNQNADCYLLTDTISETSEKRMQAMVMSNDGFYLAEQDLLLRGPGEILGSRQSGLPEFKIGNIIDDYTIMQVAREEALEFIENHKSAGNVNLDSFILGSNFLA